MTLVSAFSLSLFWTGFLIVSNSCAGEKNTEAEGSGRLEGKSHHTAGGFRNLEAELPGRGFRDFLRWRRERSKNHPTYESVLNTFPVAVPNWEVIRHPRRDGLTVTWIGHATLLVQLDGLNILTDPIFSQRSSPFQFAGPRRYTPPPLTIDELPPIHAVLISHNHYDSLDGLTVRALGNDPTWFVPLGLGKWFSRRGITNVVELDWWEKGKKGGVTLVCTPTQHFSGRGFFDRNETLWCSWVVAGRHKRFWFGGDSGYCSVFRQIGDRYGPFDLAAIPIGAYNPEWFMHPMHVTPEEAVQIHEDIRSNRSIGIHWGTFLLTDEPVDEPPKRLQIALEEKKLPKESFVTLKHGETTIVR